MNNIDKFLKISEKIGKDFSLIQGPGGNSSYKINNKIKIKKTGTYLKNSLKENIFIEENLENLQTFYENRNDNKKFNEEFSIETPLHIIFNQKFVFHYHSILSIILSVSKEIDEIRDICKNAKIKWIPYKRPGNKLAQEIAKFCEDSNNNKFFLQNHGLLIASNDINEILGDIYYFEKLFLETLDINKNNLYQKIKLEKVYENGFCEYKFINLDKQKLFNNKIFFPDHAVFANLEFKDIQYLNETHKEGGAYINNQKFIVKKKLNKVESDVLSVVLTIYNSSKKIYNFISHKDAADLVHSEDELLRLERNK